MIDRLYFDIETGPQPYRAIEGIITYEDDATPKLGNAKKPETIARKKQEWEENKTREGSSTMERCTRKPL
jgi:hypothetical protein